MTAPNRGSLTTEGHPQRTVAEQIAELTIAAPLPPLALTDLVTKPPPWGYDFCVVGAFLTKRNMNVHVARHSLPSVWEPGRGVEVDELEAAFIYFDLSISWMFERSSTRGHDTSTACYSSCMNSSQGNFRTGFP
ncbi:hypothetical protein LINGRAHAP2_LOCUS824 [Linum grandiflorum]